METAESVLHLDVDGMVFWTGGLVGTYSGQMYIGIGLSGKQVPKSICGVNHVQWRQ